jgi:Domain of unknown function (DUF4160)
MPKLLDWHGHRFHFYSGDTGEPPHVHVRKGRMEAKIWLHDCSVAANIRYSERELRELVEVTREHREAFLNAWNAFFAR